ncbi:MAG: hypothetical protein C0617_09210 [Desulfuromonas sp.]|uniref:hypothetical protein n=1 Tax=Desulfuromonas sp. TaxID=892 RepID=UPI000CB162DA|nr:hypothetical protein [Desulfuromonas sp.]PLX84102.1 MAG: hypothetical protein C0617_09210 [Desulfuromonas sp.]
MAKQKKKQDSVFKEAWENMSGDFERLLPEKLRERKGKKKFVLWLFVLELLVLGAVGKFVWEWWVGR